MLSTTGTPGKRPDSVPRPKRCAHLDEDPRGFPIIATVRQEPGEVDFGTLSEKRKLALATFDLCAVCGKPFGDELRWQVAFERRVLTDESIATAEAPVHEVCALYAAQICPFVSSPHARFGDEQRKGTKRPDILILVGYRRTSAVRGARSDVQADSVLHFEMTDLAASHTIADAEQSRQLYATALYAEPELRLDAEEQALVDFLFTPTTGKNEDSGGVLAGAAWYCGAAFCPDVRQVQGMDHYAKGKSYDGIAARLLTDPESAVSLSLSGDAATRVAMNWLRTRPELPAVLTAWRKLGRRQLEAGQSARAGQTAKRAKRKQQSAGRRKNRR